MASVLYRLTPTLNLYAGLARGFETPTLNEMFYSGSGGGFNFNLKPARSRNAEPERRSVSTRSPRPTS